MDIMNKLKFCCESENTNDDIPELNLEFEWTNIALFSRNKFYFQQCVISEIFQTIIHLSILLRGPITLSSSSNCIKCFYFYF